MNPLLQDWTTPFGLAPFDQITDDHFAPAFDEALDAARADIAAIADNPEPATFANTIAAQQTVGAKLDQVLSVFYSVAGADSNESREALMREFSPKLAAYGSEIFSNKALFARVDAVWQARDTLELTDEEARV